jgi:hypothetical protein
MRDMFAATKDWVCEVAVPRRRRRFRVPQRALSLSAALLSRIPPQHLFPCLVHLPACPQSDPIWQNFTYTPFTYRQAMDPVGSAETESAAECAALCGAEQACDTYAWCPDTAVQG